MYGVAIKQPFKIHPLEKMSRLEASGQHRDRSCADVKAIMGATAPRKATGVSDGILTDSLTRTRVGYGVSLITPFQVG